MREIGLTCMPRSGLQIWPIGLHSLFKPESTHWRHCVGSTIKGNHMLTPDFKEFAALLNSNGVEYLVVGGYALAVYDIRGTPVIWTFG